MKTIKNIINNIIDLYNYNKALAIGTILFLAECLMYIISTDWPEWFSNADEWYNFIYNLGLAYICTYIFFIFQSYRPYKKKSEIALNILKPSINNLCENMSFVISFFNYFVDINDEKVKVEYLDENNFVFYDCVKLSDQKELKTRECKNVVKYFNEYYMTYQKLIDEIKSKTVYQSCDEELIEIISELELCKFQSELKNIANCIVIPEISFGIDIKGECDEFESLKIKLEKFNKVQTKYQFISLNEEEIKKYKAQIKKYEPCTNYINNKLTSNK